ncbi:glycosyltransferase family 4 protein [Nitrospira sp. T9]|uniref:glycosyltransferase family 4 protein n=1 Tax=unclassified Nitrospira TaxID=2652172 RepID=UPI003F968596
MIHVPNGLPFKMARYARPCKEDVEEKLTSKTLKLLFVGRINKLKGFDLVIAACRRLDQYVLEHEDISILVHIVGKRTLEGETLLNAAKFERVDFRVHGYVNDDMLNQLYRESAFCFFLSQNEGFGLPLLESAWFRCIPVLSNIPVFRKLMGQDYPLFPADFTSCEAIVDFIHQMRSSQRDRESVLEMIERVVETHRDGYERAAREVLGISCTKEYSKQLPSIG